MKTADRATIGVVIVTFRSADVIAECLESLFRSDYDALKIVICENASNDETVAEIRACAQEQGRVLDERRAGAAAPASLAPLTLLHAGRNLGYAGGVNLGLEALRADSEVSLFWVLNPDCAVAADAASCYARLAQEVGTFGLMGGRTLFQDVPQRIQSDGGRVSLWTGACSNTNQGSLPEDAALPSADTIDYIIGANIMASRAFVERVGPMCEDYFLYYEEVDWALRRGDLALVQCLEALVYHKGGTAIGTGSPDRRPSAFANYFNYRNRLRFLARFNRAGLPISYVYSLSRIAKLVALGAWDEADGAFRGLHQLPPPRDVAARVKPDAAPLAFGRWAKQR
ncbi:MAG: hypothetical protein Kilf2KO_06320 [Rhodospirillales bacterium]